MQTDTGPKYYKTGEPLYNPRTLCITGRKSRVWKAIEVIGPNSLEAKPNALEVVLKDCWVDGNADTEKEIQNKIFKRLAEVREADYAWAPKGLRTRLEDALAHPEKYFMKIILDWDLGLNKAKPRCRADPDLLSCRIERSVADSAQLIPSTQTPLGTGGTSHSSAPHLAASYGRDCQQRRYCTKRHYCVIYAEVGESLAYATSLSDAVRAFDDIFICKFRHLHHRRGLSNIPSALTVLFLARWVHRDISEGNIILVRRKGGVRAKLSDLEYAQSFGDTDRVVGTDPKTVWVFMGCVIPSHVELRRELPTSCR
jgi:hypothetical protein